MLIKKKLESLLIYLIIFIGIVVTLFPTLWALYNSFLAEEHIVAEKIFYPLTLENYQYILSLKTFLISMKNSTIVCLSATMISIVIGALAAYGLTRLKSNGQTFAFFLLGFRMLPGIALIIPTFLIAHRMNLLDTYWPVIAMYLTFSLPFTAWMLRGFFMSIPREIIEAAELDGCSEIGVFWKIVVPGSKPAIWSTGAITFLFCWNDFLYALILTDQKAITFLPFITRFWLSNRFLYGKIFAGSMLFIIPILIVLVSARKHLFEGFTFGIVQK